MWMTLIITTPFCTPFYSKKQEENTTLEIKIVKKLETSGLAVDKKRFPILPWRIFFKKFLENWENLSVMQENKICSIFSTFQMIFFEIFFFLTCFFFCSIIKRIMPKIKIILNEVISETLLASLKFCGVAGEIMTLVTKWGSSGFDVSISRKYQASLIDWDYW